VVAAWRGVGVWLVAGDRGDSREAEAGDVPLGFGRAGRRGAHLARQRRPPAHGIGPGASCDGASASCGVRSDRGAPGGRSACTTGEPGGGGAGGGGVEPAGGVRGSATLA